MTATDTIYALSSGSGRAAVAVIRVSGPQASSLLVSLTGSLPPPRRLALRALADPATGDVLDKAMVAWLPGPRSFTGEDCAEFHLHGSPAVVSAILQLLSSATGVRPAEPGEFTRRAFLNGKMDLLEVEGLADLLDARTAGQRRQAIRQMSGQASSHLDGWRHQLMLIRAGIEASLDFADEPGVAEEASRGIGQQLLALKEEMEEAVRQSAASEIIRDGLRVVLAGYPNTGKSSLLNALARRDAAIVSDVPGTTRDAIEVMLDVKGVPVRLTDTAGLRRAVADIVEEEGIRRSRRHIAEADVVIWVWSVDVEGSSAVDADVSADLVVLNKYDLAAAQSRLLRNDQKIFLSTKTYEGISEFVERLAGLVEDRYGNAESVLFVSARQKRAAEQSIRHLNDALEAPMDRLELKAEHIRLASEDIGRITGRVDVEEWLGAIFSRFCIGK